MGAVTLLYPEAGCDVMREAVSEFGISMEGDVAACDRSDFVAVDVLLRLAGEV